MNFDTNSGALFCGEHCHRLLLWRTWDKTLQKVNFVMLNPSKANDIDDDPTIDKVIAICKKNGFGGVVVTNLFTLVSSDPIVLKPDSKLKESEIVTAADHCSTIVCAWGKQGQDPKFKGRHLAVLGLLKKSGKPIYCLGMNNDGSPKHPCYLKQNTKLKTYKC